MIWPCNTRGSFPIIIGSTNAVVGVTGVTSAFGTLQLCRPEYPGSTFRGKVLSAGSWKELGLGLYKVSLSNVELGTACGKFLYAHYTKKGLPYYGMIQLFKHDLQFLGTMQGTMNLVKLRTAGTFSYANMALIPGLGTHLQSRIDGSVKRNIAGTFSYANIALIPGLGTHLQSRITGSIADASALGTHLNSRIPGTIKRGNEGTFSYANITLIPGLGTHLQSRIPGSVKRDIAGTFSYALIAQIGTHLTARTGSIRTVQGSVNLVKLRTTGTFSYANVALIPGLGTHLQSRIDGSVKRNTAGTFQYALIAQIGTHLNARISGSIPSLTILGTHLNSRITGTVTSQTKNALGIATLINRIDGSVKRNITGTFSYANVALIPGLGTHLQTRVTGSVADASALGTHLNSRIPGTIKRWNEGTFNYSLIAQIGTHLTARTGSIIPLGTHLQSRIAGTIKRSIAGTFSYANVTLIATLGTHLQSRITGSIADASALGTHLNSRITGTIVSGSGSLPSYLGSVIWGRMNPQSFEALPNTFGQRIQKILDRASSGVGGVAVGSQAFGEKEKKLLFDWIKAMTERIATIEVVISQFNPETKKNLSEVVIEIKKNQTKLEETLQGYLKLDTKQKENIKGDLNLIANSFVDIADMHKKVGEVKNSLVRLSEEMPKLIKAFPKEITTAFSAQTQEVKNLITQSINIASDVSGKLTSNLIILEEQRKDLKLTDKVLLTLVPAEKLKSLIEEENES